MSSCIYELVHVTPELLLFGMNSMWRAEATVLPADSFVLFDKEMKLWVRGAFYKLGLREGS